MREEAFEALVAEALEALPEEIRRHIDNVAITVADWPSPADLASTGHRSPYALLGLYQGIPLTRRGRGYNLVPPDRIVLFRGPIEHLASSPAAIRELVQRTVVHEIAHHFGIDDARLRELGY